MKIYENFSTLSELHAHLKAEGITSSYGESVKWARKNIPKESYFQKKILDYLRNLLKTGVILGHTWKTAGDLYQSAGFPDVSIVTGKLFFGFEVKRPILGQPSELQKVTAAQLRAGGGVVEFVSYVSEVEAILRAHGVLEGGGACDAQ